MENAFQLRVTCRLTRSSCAAQMHRDAARGEVKPLRSIIKMPSVLAREIPQHQRCADLKALLLNLCQPVFPEKNVVSFHKQRGPVTLSYEKELPVKKNALHNRHSSSLSEEPDVMFCRLKKTKQAFEKQSSRSVFTQTDRSDVVSVGPEFGKNKRYYPIKLC